ncbi:truncated SilB [Streptococcus pyogenes]|nr:truncated SilB [Streptococcus pyogenes]
MSSIFFLALTFTHVIILIILHAKVYVYKVTVKNLSLYTLFFFYILPSLEIGIEFQDMNIVSDIYQNVLLASGVIST